jgi:hypothetical protein
MLNIILSSFAIRARLSPQASSGGETRVERAKKIERAFKKP